MRTLSLALLFSVAATVSQAADATDPVKEVMRITSENWKTAESDWKFIFDAEPLAKLFSKRFQAAYHEAAKHPAYDTDNGQPGDPFGYDVITNSQDGCPLQDLKLEQKPGKDGATDVGVSFKFWTCMDDDEIKNSVDTVHFDVITEDGRPVIDDIHRYEDDESDSVYAEMQELAKGQ